MFLQIDSENKIRTGKFINYDFKGKRTGIPFWLHKFFKIENFNLEQCLFGTHLINDKPIMLVEGEKTALIGAITKPKYTWLASGGKNNLNLSMLKPLENKDVLVIPDVSRINKRTKRDNFTDWK